jgi:hypothetical protein
MTLGRKTIFGAIMAAILLSCAIGLPLLGQIAGRVLPTPGKVTFTFAQGVTSNQQDVTVKLGDRNGNGIPGQPLTFFFSDSPSGSGVTATASSGTAGIVVSAVDTAATPNASILFVTNATPTVTTSRIPMELITDQTGSVTIGVVDSAKTNYYPVVITRNGGLLAVGAKMTTANYK